MHSFRRVRLIMGQPNSKIEHKPLEEAVKQIDLLNKSAKIKIGELQEIIDDHEKYTSIIQGEKDMIIKKIYKLNAKSKTSYSKLTQTETGTEARELSSSQGVVTASTSNHFNRTDEEKYYPPSQAEENSDEMKRRISYLEKELDNERKCFNETRRQHECEQKSIVETKRQLENEMRQQTLEIANLKAEKMNLKTTIDQERQQYQKYRQQQGSEFVKMVETNRLHVNEIKEKTLEIEKLKAEKNDMKTSIENTKYELNINLEKIKAEELKVQEMQSYNQKLESVIKKTNEENQDLQITNNKLITDLEVKEIKTEERMKELQIEIDGLGQKDKTNMEEIDKLQQEINKLKTEIETLQQSQRRKKEICFKSVLKQPQSDIAVAGILSLLQEKMKGVDLEVVPDSKRDGRMPLLVVFYFLSRITDDAKGALEKSGVKADSTVALIVLNQGNKNKDLRSTSKRVLTSGPTGKDFDKLGLIVDMSFLTADGIITNELTINAIEELAAFINTH